MLENEKKELFESMPVRRAIYTMAIPTIISQLINLIYNVVDTYFIGRTGNSYMIAAVSVVYTLYIMNVALSNLFGIGGGSLVARLSGRNEYEKAKSVSAYSVYGGIVIAILYSLIIAAFCNPILKLLGASNEIMGFAKQYVYTVIVIGNIPTILSAVLAHLIRNSGYSKQASIGLSAGGILNIILDPLFMFVILPSGYEVLGAAIATLISNMVACIYLFFFYKKIEEKSSLSTNIKDAKKIRKSEIKQLYSVGIPSAILTGLFDLANMFLNAKMAVYGEEALAALGIVMKAERLPNAINIGICQGIMPIIAYNYSSNNKERMYEIQNKATKYGVIITLISLTLFEIFAEPITGIFFNVNAETAYGAKETLMFAATFLRIRCLSSPFQFFNYRSSFFMQAMGDGKDTLIHAVVRELVFYIPLMFILNSLFGIKGLLFSLVVGEGLGMIFAIILLNRWLKRSDK